MIFRRRQIVLGIVLATFSLFILGFGWQQWESDRSPLGAIDQVAEVRISGPPLAFDGRYLVTETYNGEIEPDRIPMPDEYTTPLVVHDFSTGRSRELEMPHFSKFPESLVRHNGLVLDNGRLVSSEGILNVDTGQIQPPSWPEDFEPHALRGPLLYGIGPGWTNGTVHVSVADVDGSAAVQTIVINYTPLSQFNYGGQIVAASEQFFVVAIDYGSHHWDKSYWLVNSVSMQVQEIPLNWHEWLADHVSGTNHAISLTSRALVMAVNQPNGTAVVRILDIPALSLRSETAIAIPPNGQMPWLTANEDRWALQYYGHSPLGDSRYPFASRVHTGLAWGDLRGNLLGSVERSFPEGSAVTYTKPYPMGKGILYAQGATINLAHPEQFPWPGLSLSLLGAALFVGSIVIPTLRIRRLSKLAGGGRIRCLNCGKRRERALAFCPYCGWRTDQEHKAAVAPVDPWDKER